MHIKIEILLKINILSQFFQVSVPQKGRESTSSRESVDMIAPNVPVPGQVKAEEDILSEEEKHSDYR